MKHSTSFCILLGICLAFFTSCTKDVEMGQQKVDASSLLWLPDAGETADFKSNSTSAILQMTTNNQKSNFISSPDCDRKFPKETCYHYDMQQVFITSNTANKKIAVTYSVIRSIKDGQFYDRLEVSTFENEKTFANMSIITWAANPAQLEDKSGYSIFHDEITLEGKTFQNVYQKLDIGGEVYFSKEMGLVAFETGDGVLWVLQ